MPADPRNFSGGDLLAAEQERRTEAEDLLRRLADSIAAFATIPGDDAWTVTFTGDRRLLGDLIARGSQP